MATTAHFKDAAPAAWQGRSQQGEARDCAVLALAIAAGASYEAAHAALRAAGRKRRSGAKLIAWIRDGKLPGFKFRRVVRRNQTLARFLREHPQGRFLCVKYGHAFAVVDGVCLDSWARKPGEIVKAAWVVEKDEKIV